MATNAELIKALRDWKVEMVGVISDYKDAIAKLENIEKNFNKSWKEYLKAYLPSLAQIITVLAIIGFLIYYSTKVECGVTIEFLGLKISRVCPQPISN
jgi:TRAP-type C4-dicarboxylate transport system permease large subunit